jgi:hypothetical protein
MEMVTLNRRLLDAMQGHIDERQGVGMTVGVANVVVIKSMDAVGSAANCGLLQEVLNLLVLLVQKSTNTYAAAAAREMC